MTIYNGSNSSEKMYVGTQIVDKVYLGGNVVWPMAIINNTPPSIVGDMIVGSSVYPYNDTWTPIPETFSVIWYRNGEPISGATAVDYTIVTADIGQAITAQVTASKSGYTSAAATTAARIGIAASTSTPSTAMPTAAFIDSTTGTNWGVPIYTEDFNTAVPMGPLWKVDQGTGLPAGNPYDAKMGAYEPYQWNGNTQQMEPFLDTHKVAIYETEKTTWTDNGALHLYLHSEAMSEWGGKVYPLGGTFVPKLGNNYYSQFIRASFRFRLQEGQSSNYGGVWQFIHDQHWPQWGEFDFPEGGYNDEVRGYLHRASNTPNQQEYAPTSPKDYNDWHIATQQWEPAANGVDHRIRWYLDGELILDESGPQIGSGSMPKVFMFQTGAGAPHDYFPGGVFPNDATAHYELDWISIWKHPAGTV